MESKRGEKYWVLNMALEATTAEDKGDYYSNEAYKKGNYFRSKEECKQASEEVCKCLESFHKRKEGERND